MKLPVPNFGEAEHQSRPGAELFSARAQESGPGIQGKSPPKNLGRAWPCRVAECIVGSTSHAGIGSATLAVEAHPRSKLHKLLEQYSTAKKGGYPQLTSGTSLDLVQ